MYKRRNINVLMIAIATLSLVIIVSLVYAGFTGQLNITGTAVVRDSKWDIHFENVSTITTTGTAKVLSNHQPVINSNNPTQIQDYEVSLTSPSDSISFTFDVVNDGNYNAKITSVSVGTPQCTSTDTTSATNMCNNLTYTLKYSSGATINQNSDIVYAKDKVTMKVTLTFNDINDASLLPTAGVSISNLGIQINFEQEGNALVNETTGEVINTKVYHVGDKVTVNNEDYWVIAYSGTGQDYVVALKVNLLTASEVNQYGIDENEINHINKEGNLSNDGLVAYDFNEQCNSYRNNGGCNKYDDAQIKYIVDAWASDKFLNNELKEVDGYKARLIKLNEANDNLLCNQNNCGQSPYVWIYNVGRYWVYESGNSATAKYIHDGTIHGYHWRMDASYYVRPVINVYKSALETNNNNVE